MTKCPKCFGYCRNGAQCAISQFLGKPLDWSALYRNVLYNDPEAEQGYPPERASYG